MLSNNGHGERNLDLTYEIGGKELVYTGMDGDEYHSKVHWEGDSLVFTTVEHERGRLIPSEEDLDTDRFRQQSATSKDE